MENKLRNLIDLGKKFSFANNSIHESHGVYSRASVEFLAWVAEIEHYVINNYDEDSGPAILFKTLDKSQFSGYYQSSFESQLQILKGVLIACNNIQPLKRNKQEDNQILSLIKSPLFWSILTILIGASFTLGVYFGNTRFDSNMILLTEEKKALLDTVKIKENLINVFRNNSDSALNILSHLPYSELKIDSLEFNIIQSTIEKVGEVLRLNK